MKIEDLKKLSPAALAQESVLVKEKIRKLRFLKATKLLEDTSSIAKHRKQYARIKTQQNSAQPSTPA